MYLDTSFCIDLLQERRRGQVGPATRKLRELEQVRLSLSLFVLCELHVGVKLSRDPERELTRVVQLTEIAAVVFPDSALPAAYGEVRAHLTRVGTPIPVMDALIGAMAKLAGQPLLARHPEHFALIPGLAVETYR